MPELWDQPSLTFWRGLCPPAARHSPGERGEATGGTQTRLLQKTGSKPVWQRPAVGAVPRPWWTVASTVVSGAGDRDRAVSPEPDPTIPWPTNSSLWLLRQVKSQKPPSPSCPGFALGPPWPVHVYHGSLRKHLCGARTKKRIAASDLSRVSSIMGAKGYVPHG